MLICNILADASSSSLEAWSLRNGIIGCEDDTLKFGSFR